VLALLVQVGARPHSGSLLGPLLLIGVCVAVGGLLLPLVRLAVSQARARIGGWRRVGSEIGGRRRVGSEPGGRRRVGSEIGGERRARAMMGELCPHGWRAELTLYEGRAVTESGDPVRAPVALDWHELRRDGGEPAVVRRVWAPSVVEALEAMVADRRTDVALEQIELRASADGASWPDA
jgi:hypothetical protein